MRFTLAQNAEGEIKAEPDLLRQLLLNLIANAVSASPPGGLVQLESSPTGTGWQFTVTDEGPGIPDDHLPRIFDRFVRFDRAPDAARTRTGHGLGLAICRSIVQLHHGTICAENRRDRTGLRAVVSLPR